MTDYNEALDIIEGMWDELDLSYDPEMYAAYSDISGFEAEEVDAWSEEADERYQGEHKSDGDMAREYHEGMYNSVPEELSQYIDWDSVASDMMYDMDEVAGHYFANY